MKNAHYLPSITALVAANLVPLVGAIFFGWDVFAILVLYWLESAVVGFYNVFKLQKAAAPSAPAEIAELRGYQSEGKSAAGLTGKALVRFFICHYGVFMSGHAFFLAVFIFVFSSSKFSALPIVTPAFWLTALVSVASFAGSHGISYAVNFVGKEEFLRISPARQFMQPYRRIVVMHLTIIGGGFLLIFTPGSPLAFLIAMILTKIFIDMFYHLREHKQLAPTGAAEVPQASDASEMP